MVWPVNVVDDGVLKIAAAAGLPQRIRVASALHSHAGMSPMAYGARRGSFTKPRRDPPSRIHAIPPPADFVGLSNLFETVIGSAIRNVHAAKGLRTGGMTLTLTAGRTGGGTSRKLNAATRWEGGFQWPINRSMISFPRKCGSSLSRACSRRRRLLTT